MYEGHSDWRVARDNLKSVLYFGFSPGKLEFQVSELTTCGYVSSFDPHIHSSCRSGSLSITNFEPRSLAGDYSFTLKDGTIKKGDFSATYCPKRSGHSAD